MEQTVASIDGFLRNPPEPFDFIATRLIGRTSGAKAEFR